MPVRELLFERSAAGSPTAGFSCWIQKTDLWRLVQVPKLKEDPELSEMAQDWADRLAASGKLEHSHDMFNGQPVGQNVASKSSSGNASYTGIDRRVAVVIWREHKA